MANLVAHLNAQPISTRFRIQPATVRAVQVMREPTGINLPAGARGARRTGSASQTLETRTVADDEGRGDPVCTGSSQLPYSDAG